MSTQTEVVQAAARALTGTTLSFQGDLHAYFTLVGVPDGQFDERLLAWARTADATIGTSAAAFNYLLAHPPVASNPELWPQPLFDSSVGLTLNNCSVAGGLWISTAPASAPSALNSGALPAVLVAGQTFNYIVNVTASDLGSQGSSLTLTVGGTSKVLKSTDGAEVLSSTIGPIAGSDQLITLAVIDSGCTVSVTSCSVIKI